MSFPTSSDILVDFVFIFRYGDILIEKLRVDDSGEYKCFSSDRSHAYFGTVALEVIGNFLFW